MLISAQINHFRSCVGVNVSDIGPMLVLLGRNGVGKTNILLAIEWAAQVGSSITGEIPEEYGDVAEADVSLRFILEGVEYEYSLKSEQVLDSEKQEPVFTLSTRVLTEELTEQLPGGAKSLIFHRNRQSLIVGTDHQRGMEIGIGSPAAYAIASLLPSDPITAKVVRVMFFLNRVKYLSLDTPAKEDRDYFVVRESQFLAWKGRTSKAGDALKQLNFQLLDLKLNDQKRYEEFVNLVGEKGLGLIADLIIKDFDFPSELAKASNGQTEKYYIFTWGIPNGGIRRGYAFHDLSYGTRRLLRLFAALIYEKPTILLVEQPEDGIHKGLLHKVIPALESYCEFCQIITATHAAEILNRVKPEHVRLVSMADAGTQVRELSKVELTAARDFISDEGGLADFLDLLPN